MYPRLQGTVTAPAVGSNGLVSVALGALAKGATAAVNVVVKVTAPAGTVLTDRATVSARHQFEQQQQLGDPENIRHWSEKVTTGGRHKSSRDLFRSVVETGESRGNPAMPRSQRHRSRALAPWPARCVRTSNPIRNLSSSCGAGVAGRYARRDHPRIFTRLRSRSVIADHLHTDAARPARLEQITGSKGRGYPLAEDGRAGLSPTDNPRRMKELMMNARLLVAVALPLLFIAPGLPESRLSADQDEHHQRRRWHSRPDGRFNHCLHQHARQLPSNRGHYPQHARLSPGKSTSSIT